MTVRAARRRRRREGWGRPAANLNEPDAVRASVVDASTRTLRLAPPRAFRQEITRVPMAQQTTPNASTTRSSRVLLCFRARSSRFRPRPGHARMLTSFNHDIAARLVHAARCRSPAKSRTPGTWRRRLFPLVAGRSRPTRPQASTNERRRSRLLRPTANALHSGSPVANASAVES